MAKFQQPLTPEEVKARRKTPGSQLDLTPYSDYFKKIQPRHAGRIELEDGDKKATIKRRVTMAATHSGRKVKNLRSGENELIFELSSAS